MMKKYVTKFFANNRSSCVSLREPVTKMSKAQARRDFACIHTGCAFKTDKRKAIYTHLVRTHCERKEDYECEYCDTLFEEETVIEEHLYSAHPGCQFRYTCVSRLENLLKMCAQLAADRKKNSVAKKNITARTERSSTVAVNTEANQRITNDIQATKDDDDVAKEQIKLKNLNESSLKRKAIVNESLNNLAKLPRIIPPDEISNDTEINETFAKSDETRHDLLNEEEEFISKPSGLKIKLNLKKIRDSCSRESSTEPQYFKEGNDSASELMEMSPLGEIDLQQIESSVTEDDVPVPDIPIPNITTEKEAPELSKDVKPPKSKSSYLENLEVYHTTDEFNRRCCPFCDYKTTKNTIRVHLSGKHKIYFVMCSICDYRAAFPYQVQAHGLSSHKVRNVEVIHLAKSYREGVIARIKAGMAEGSANENSTLADDSLKDEAVGGENNGSGVAVKSEELVSPKIPAENRVFKPPVCQTTKTDYYNIVLENDTYLYCCNQCDFRTPVRATIYTHKYRHDEKAFKCGYCDFITSPRSNVAHHIRGRHKGKAFVIEELGAEQLKRLNQSSIDEVQLDDMANEDFIEVIENQQLSPGVGEGVSLEVKHAFINNAEQNKFDNPTATEETQPNKMIIKVPQFKRTLHTVVPNRMPDFGRNLVSVSETRVDQNDDSHKMSINKLYRYNPKGTPKYLCNQCPYACDTHPKMKHHLYRHKPQRYKCGYCNHRKYPRSYVVRHVRDTHRDKPMKIIDLQLTGEIEDDVTDDMTFDDGKAEDFNDLSDQAELSKIDVQAASICGEEREINESMESPNASSINQPLHSSTPLTGSTLFDMSSATPQLTPSKPIKNYDVDTKRKPRYICNFCQYGTENFKTIRKHMYTHERIKFRCPYCGFERAPRSVVEIHINKVHTGQPVFVTETIDENATNIATDGLDSASSKRKDPPTSNSPSSRFPMLHKKLKSEDTAPPSGKLPSQKVVSKISLPPHEMPPLQIPVKPKTPGSSISPMMPNINIPQRPPTVATGPPNVTVSNSSPIPFPQKQTHYPSVVSTTPTVVKKEPQQTTVAQKSSMNAVPQSAKPSYKEGGKTTFKTMYKCVFDPETCNHISKDRSKMKQHLFMHVEYKPWSCDYCNMTASQSSHVKNHVRAEHPEAEISFQYKRHNYLEKHIETFLQKGVFTVPVSEYRFIMDMKGGTKKPQYEYARDNEGYLLCPHCDYRTKSGGMADHVKMKHMQPRFKCHWCDYKAFYRSEIRKHHRKERGHAHLEFKTQELDLVEVMADYKEGNGEVPDALQGNTLIRKVGQDAGSESGNTNDISNLQDMDDDISSDADSAISDSTELSNNLSDSAFLQFSLPYSFENIDDNNDTVSSERDNTRSEEELMNHSEEMPRCTVGVKTANYKRARKGNQSSVYKCGYCLFTAHLRTMVKIHCQKQHPYRKVQVTEPVIKNCKAKTMPTSEIPTSEMSNDLVNGKSNDVMSSFNKQELSSEALMSKIAPLFQQNKSSSVGQGPANKKSKSLKSVIDQLSSKVQDKGENDVNSGTPNGSLVSASSVENGHSSNDRTDKPTANIDQVEIPVPHSSGRKQSRPQHVLPNVNDVVDDKINIDCINCENGPPVLTKVLCHSGEMQIDNVKEADVTPPLLINETEK